MKSVKDVQVTLQQPHGQEYEYNLEICWFCTTIY